MVLDEYLTKDSDFGKAAATVEQIYCQLMNRSFQVVLGDYNVETTLRQLHQRVIELNNAIERSKGNYKKIVKEIDKLRIDLTALKNNLIEFLLMLRGRIHHFNGLFERSCIEYGLNVRTNESDKSILRWDHLRPDSATVLGSLKYIEDFSSELERSKRKYQDDLKDIRLELRSLGMKNVPIGDLGKPDFQELRYNVDLILEALDVNGLCEMIKSISKFFGLAIELANAFPDPNVTLELDSKSTEPELKEFGLKFEKKGKFAYPLLADIAQIASSTVEDAPCLITNISEISVGFETLNCLVQILKRMKLCLHSARAFLVELSKHRDVKDTDLSEEYWKLAARIPTDLEQVPTYMTTAGVFKNITRQLELDVKA